MDDGIRSKVELGRLEVLRTICRRRTNAIILRLGCRESKTAERTRKVEGKPESTILSAELSEEEDVFKLCNR